MPLDDNKKSKLYLRSQEQIHFGEYSLPFNWESSAFLFPLQIMKTNMNETSV
jgi:hypothetical protein